MDITNGSDIYNGFTPASAFKTIQRAVDVATPGSTIHIRGGYYQESLTVSNSGQEKAYITLKAFSSDTVTIDGGDQSAVKTEGETNYWIIEGLTLISKNRYTLRLGWWYESETNHWIVRDNTITGANFLIGSYHLWENNNINGIGYTHALGDAGISDGSLSHHNIYRNNIIHDFTHHDARGIWTQGLTHDTLIENNTVYNIMASSGLGQCIDLDGAAYVQWRHVVRGNSVDHCSYVGIQLENVFDAVVEQNLVSQGDAGIIVINYDANIGCLPGGENQQYGDLDGDGSCRGAVTNNIIQKNIITTDSSWSAGYGGIMVWYAGGVQITNNCLSSIYGNANASINIQGLPVETQNSSITHNIISPGSGAAICMRDYSSVQGDDNNQFLTNDPSRLYAGGNDCSNRVSLAEYQQNSGMAVNSRTVVPGLSDYQGWLFCAVPGFFSHLGSVYFGAIEPYCQNH